MNTNSTSQQEAYIVSEFSTDDARIFTFDFGVGKSISADFIDDTVVVVAETATGSEQFEFDLDGVTEPPTVTTNNGVVTVEVQN